MEAIDSISRDLALKEKAAAAAAAARTAFDKAKTEGFFSHFGDFNEEIFKPLKRVHEFSWESVKAEVLGTISLHPPNPSSEFVFFNVMALLFGIAESLIAYFFIGDSLISLIWNGGVGYCVAYTIYWIMLCNQSKNLMFGALIFLALYVAFTIWMTWSTLVFVVPAILYAIKAFCNVEMLISGFWLYKEVAGDSLLPGSMV